MADTCLIHLVRAQNGLAPFHRFIESYREHPAGAAHDLLLLYKGFARGADVSAYRAAMEGLGFQELHVSDNGFDLGAYFKAARALPHEFVCFVNSFSQIAAAGWLGHLRRHAAPPHVGAVGAGGSWGSLLTIEPNWPLNHRPLRDLVLWRRRLYFAPFPNPHLRTNGFLIRRSVFLGLREPRFRSKIDALRFESGRRGFTKQLLQGGHDVFVVGRDGEAYAPAEWAESNTFWQGDQQNLLVYDNRSADYAKGDDGYRDFAASFAWGDRARPVLRQSASPGSP